MSSIAIRRRICRRRRHLAGLLLVLALASAVAGHHSGIGMSDMHHGGMSAAVEMCVGAFVAVGTAVAAVAIGILLLGRWPTVVELPPIGSPLARAGAHGARAGPPPLFSQLCVWRR